MRKRWLVLVSVVAVGLLAIENRDAVRGYADGPFAALLVWSTVLWSQGLRAAPLRRLGDASYSIYLFHLASFWLPATLLHRFSVESTTPLVVSGVILIHVFVATTIGLAIHRFIEQPLLDFLRQRLDNDPKRSAQVLAARSP